MDELEPPRLHPPYRSIELLRAAGIRGLRSAHIGVKLVPVGGRFGGSRAPRRECLAGLPGITKQRDSRSGDEYGDSDEQSVFALR